MKKPTDKQIKAEIKKLKSMKPKIPAVTFFGDSNHDKVDAQIQVLEERMSENEVYTTFEDQENPDSTADLVSCALEAVRWMAGTEDAPSKGWSSLVKK